MQDEWNRLRNGTIVTDPIHISLNNFYPGLKFVKDISICRSYSHFVPVSFTQLELSSLHCVLCGRLRNEELSLLNCVECDDVNASLLYSPKIAT
jgi:hypothetical protein